MAKTIRPGSIINEAGRQSMAIHSQLLAYQLTRFGKAMQNPRYTESHGALSIKPGSFSETPDKHYSAKAVSIIADGKGKNIAHITSVLLKPGEGTGNQQRYAFPSTKYPESHVDIHGQSKYIWQALGPRGKEGIESEVLIPHYSIDREGHWLPDLVTAIEEWMAIPSDNGYAVTLAWTFGMLEKDYIKKGRTRKPTASPTCHLTTGTNYLQKRFGDPHAIANGAFESGAVQAVGFLQYRRQSPLADALRPLIEPHTSRWR